MNALLIPPKTPTETPPANFGSGRYYARFSQSERIGETEATLYPALWIFEAFDQVWFGQNPPPAAGDGLVEYYDRAELFVLELRIETGNASPVVTMPGIPAAEAEEAEPEDWFSLVAEPLRGKEPRPNEIRLTIYPNLYAAGIEATLLEAGPVDRETSAKLDRAVSTTHIPDASDKEVGEALAGVARASLDWSVVYDVGQGNAIGLGEPRGSVQTYFDLGGGVTGNRKTFPSALSTFCFTTKPPIILSHWDFDHWSSANRDTRSHAMTWIAPRQSVGPSHLALMSCIQKAGKLFLVSAGFGPHQYGQLYLERCIGKGRNHSGFALSLSETSGGGGKRMLFPGDARYTYIPSFPKWCAQYVSVAVPHHGGDMGNRTVPLCPQLAESRLVYSCGRPNTFSHPRHITRMDHQSAGWRDPIFGSSPNYEVRETPNRGKQALGHVLLGWKNCSAAPALACGGKTCQLEAQQP